jgi:hypothetical protein
MKWISARQTENMFVHTATEFNQFPARASSTSSTPRQGSTVIGGWLERTAAKPNEVNIQN